jgi:alpha-glucosidase
MIKRNLLLFLAVTLFYKVKSQNLNQNIGTFNSFKKSLNGITLSASNASAEVSIYSTTVIRVRISNKEFEKDFSYAVIKSPGQVNFTLKEDQGKITLETDSLILNIYKNPVYFQFTDKQKNILNEDDPAFNTSRIGTEVTVYKKLQKGERFIGLGEKTGNLDRRGSAYVNWNNDYFSYPANADPLYQSIPFYIGIHHQHVYGIFVDNTYKSTFNFGASNNRFSSFSVDDGEMNYYFIGGSDIPGIIKSYTSLTGRMEMPPLWSLGYQQSRYSYYPDKEVLNIAKTFRDKKIPSDVIYLDIHYMDAYKVFTWHPERFPEPKKMIDELKAMGFHLVVIVDPGIKMEKGYPSYEEGLKNNYFVNYPDHTPYTGEVWPGWCHFPDFTNPAVRPWWGQNFKSYVDTGVEGFWNDMNEPASWGNKTPELIEFDYDGNKSTHKRAHNIYGMQMARSTFEGTAKLMNGKRPFILTRAGYSGIQRYSSVWTGDNMATDEHMLAGIRLVNSMGISGIPFVGVDVGGFAGEASPDLYARWMSIGAYTPFFRQHAMYGSKDKEPWTFGEDIEALTRKAIGTRYQLLPYIYSSFYESSQSGIPVARSLSIYHPFDSCVYLNDYQHQFLFGPNLLVAPVSSTQKFAKVYLPKGTWFRFDSDEIVQGGKEMMVDASLERLPVFAKGGAIIPMQSLVQYTQQKSSDTLQIHIYFGDKRSEYVYYEDDGDTYKFKEGSFSITKFSFDPLKKELAWAKEGSYKPKFNYMNFIFHGFPDLSNISVNNKKVKVTKSGKGLGNFTVAGNEKKIN